MADDLVYILSNITQRLGDATEPEARLELEGYQNEDFITKGRKIGTPRLAKELARNYGIFAEWLPTATADQSELLGFVGGDWLRIAVWTGRQAEIHYDARQRGASVGSAEKHKRATHAEQLETQARHARDRLRLDLLHLAGGIPSWVKCIDGAYATPGTSTPIADTLIALCDVGDAILADPSQGIKKRLSHSKVKPSTLAKHRELAAASAAATRDASAIAPTAPVSQAQVDLWDGIAITFFEQFVEALELAREVDPTIPAPSIIGLRGWFRRGSRKNRGEVEPADDEAGNPTTP